MPTQQRTGPHPVLVRTLSGVGAIGARHLRRAAKKALVFSTLATVMAYAAHGSGAQPPKAGSQVVAAAAHDGGPVPSVLPEAPAGRHQHEPNGPGGEADEGARDDDAPRSRPVPYRALAGIPVLEPGEGLWALGFGPFQLPDGFEAGDGGSEPATIAGRHFANPLVRLIGGPGPRALPVSPGGPVPLGPVAGTLGAQALGVAGAGEGQETGTLPRAYPVEGSGPVAAIKLPRSDADLSLTAVPAPAAALLFPLGLAVFGRIQLR